MVVQNGKIAYVGMRAGAQRFFTPGVTRRINVNGNTILPGMHDVHVHPLEAGSEVAGTCELPSNTSPNRMINLFTRRRCQDDQMATDYVLGFGHSIHSLLEFINQGGNPRCCSIHLVNLHLINNFSIGSSLTSTCETDEADHFRPS